MCMIVSVFYSLSPHPLTLSPSYLSPSPFIPSSSTTHLFIPIRQLCYFYNVFTPHSPTYPHPPPLTLLSSPPIPSRLIPHTANHPPNLPHITFYHCRRTTNPNPDQLSPQTCCPRTSCPLGCVVLGPNVPCQDGMSPHRKVPA